MSFTAGTSRAVRVVGTLPTNKSSYAEMGLESSPCPVSPVLEATDQGSHRKDSLGPPTASSRLGPTDLSDSMERRPSWDFIDSGRPYFLQKASPCLPGAVSGRGFAS